MILMIIKILKLIEEAKKLDITKTMTKNRYDEPIEACFVAETKILSKGNKTIEKTYNELLDFQKWLENSSKKIINEMKQEIKELELNLEDKWDGNLENIQEEIIKIGNKIISEYGETITLDDIDSSISKKFELLSNIRDISWLIEDTKILEYIPLYSDNSIYDYEIGYSYILIKKETGCLYLLSGVQSNHRPTLEKIAENFDEFMERLYIADPIDFEDNNDR